jgi:hypothetical protein
LIGDWNAAAVDISLRWGEWDVAKDDILRERVSDLWCSCHFVGSLFYFSEMKSRLKVAMIKKLSESNQLCNKELPSGMMLQTCR